MKKAAPVIILSQCSFPFRMRRTTYEILTARPTMSPVGSGVGQSFNVADPAYYPTQPRPQKYSLWQEKSGNFFRDPRAANPGDLLTVVIRLDDEAKFDNKSNRSRVSSLVYGAR